MRNSWPTRDELVQLQAAEDRRAAQVDEEADPICECGEPGWACCCERLAADIGYWPDGTVVGEDA